MSSAYINEIIYLNSGKVNLNLKKSLGLPKFIRGTKIFRKWLLDFNCDVLVNDTESTVYLINKKRLLIGQYMINRCGEIFHININTNNPSCQYVSKNII